MLRGPRSLLLTLLFFLAISVGYSLLVTANASFCNRTCGGNKLSYPFGFSSGCEIPLNCSSTGEMLLDEFVVQNVSNDSMTIRVPAKCNRPFQYLRKLYTKNYAPRATNALLLQSCSSSAVQPCDIPVLNVTTHFESMNCSGSLSCFSKVTVSEYLNISQMSKCDYLMASILAANRGLSLEVQVMELGWWLNGRCNCSQDADCTPGVAETGGTGYRCRCKDGFLGDGYGAGVGCRKAEKGSLDCQPEKFFAGRCGGATGIGIIVGGVIAGATLMVGVGLLCCFIRKRRASRAQSISKQRLAESIKIPIYPYKEIEKATCGFAEKQRLGTGAYGTVYAGKLHSDSWVAIKRIRNRGTDSVEQVTNEIKLISSVSHPNLVRLMGCSIENGEQILVYEFMPNGTLCQHLQRERGDGLPWPVRLTIASETAQAIAHLHSAIDPPIYHRDIKSSNILLDYNFGSKVADFGLSRLGMTEISHISTAPQGTPGYLDPQYHQNFHLSDKSDVYSFGVVLVEIITALKAVDFSRPQNEVNLAALATDRIVNGRIDEIADPLLDVHSDAWTLSSVHRVAELAFRCLAFHRDTRPTMMEVAAELEQIKNSKWTPSEEINCTGSSEISPCSSSSNMSERPLNLTIKKPENAMAFRTEGSSLNSMDRTKHNSPISVQDPWLSEQSSPSSSSLPIR